MDNAHSDFDAEFVLFIIGSGPTTEDVDMGLQRRSARDIQSGCQSTGLGRVVRPKRDCQSDAGLLSNPGEKSINFYSIMVPLRKKY